MAESTWENRWRSSSELQHFSVLQELPSLLRYELQVAISLYQHAFGSLSLDDVHLQAGLSHGLKSINHCGYCKSATVLYLKLCTCEQQEWASTSYAGGTCRGLLAKSPI